LLASTAVLSNLEFKSMKSYGLSLGMVLLIGVAPIYVVPERRPSFGSETGNYRVFLDEHRISDERRIYSRYGLGLLRSLKDGAPRAPYTRENWIFHAGHPVQVELVGPLGLAGYGFGPDVHVIDLNGLADALMARMPLKDPGSWRIGHFRHVIPEGYLETLAAGENLIVDENIALYYDKLAFVIKGDLWSWPRLVEIWNLNTGKYDYLLERTASGQE
jgi:arabinofuranosyltransferase